MTRLLVIVLCALLVSGPAAAEGDLLAVQKVTDDVYAVVGPFGNRTPANLGNNATFGFVVTREGVVLIDSGGSLRGAQALEAAIRQVTDEPVTAVINTGGQDHRWLGNDYFRSQGARIIASENAVEDQRSRARDQLFVLDNLLGSDLLAGTEPVHADDPFSGGTALEIGGKRFELLDVGPAHTPGDTLVWLPGERVVFSGDVVYVGRMLGVIGVSSSSQWLAAFDAMADLEPAVVVPGHGPVTDIPAAKADTYDYLAFLRQTVGEFMDNGGDIMDVGGLDQSRFSYLENFAELQGRNAQRVYEELEWE